MAALYYVVSNFARDIFRRISQLWDNAHMLNLENRFLYLCYNIAISQILSSELVFDFIFYCVTLHTYKNCLDPRSI